MNLILKTLFFLIIAVSFSCEENGLNIDCSDCLEEEPEKTMLEIKLDHYSYSKTVVKIYEGNLEDSVLVGTFTPTSSTFVHEVTVNKKYTVTATYIISDDTYIAVDSATPRVKYDKNKCEEACYFVYDKDLNLRLKYTK